MIRFKKASEILRVVDPDLNLIDRGKRRRWKVTGLDWARAGAAECPSCKKETLRFRDGVCIECTQQLDEKHDRDKKRKAKLQRQIKAHNLRIKKRAT